MTVRNKLLRLWCWILDRVKCDIEDVRFYDELACARFCHCRSWNLCLRLSLGFCLLFILSHTLLGSVDSL